MKRKERVYQEVVVGDASLEDAARALTEFCILAHMPPRSPARSLETTSTPSLAPLPQWSRRRMRSCKIKRVECSSNDSHTTVSDNPLVQQVSECSSSVGNESQSATTLVKVELFSSEEQRCPTNNLERHDKLVSGSSTESPEFNSGADSPSSPLPTIRTDEVALLGGVPNFGSSPEAGRSAFQKVAPIRPVKKPTVSRKLKAEEKFFDPAQAAAVKLVSRKKPRPAGMMGQLAPVKIEEADTLCTLALGPGGPYLGEEKKRMEETTNTIFPYAGLEANVAELGPVSVKVESRQHAGRLSNRTSGKLKPALSESEKEARRQRRVQANRESARQTIRRKQVLCEELSKKSQHLSAENEAFRKELDSMRQKHKSLKEMNAHLADQVQVAKGSSSCGRGFTAPQPAVSSVEKQPNLAPVQFPVHFAGLPIPPPAYVWAFAVAQAAQAAGIPAGEMSMGAEYASALATVFGRSLPAGFWMGSGGTGQQTLLPPFFAPQPRTSITNLPSSSVDASFSPLTRSVSLPTTPAEASFSVAASGAERTLASSKSLASYRSGDVGDASSLSHNLQKSVSKREASFQEAGDRSQAHYFKSETGTAGPAARSVLSHRSGDGSCLASMSTAQGEFRGRSHGNGGGSLLPKMVNSRYSMFGAAAGRCFQDMPIPQERPTLRESEAQRAAAAATEARRRRREVTRTKSLLYNRQAARLAEPSAS